MFKNFSTFLLSPNPYQVEDREPSEIAELLRLTRAVRFFQSLSEAMREQLCQVMTVEDMAAGSVVFEQGTEGTTFYVILSGSVDVNVRDAISGTTFTATQLFLGDSFGELALVNNALRGATIVCVQDCSFLKIEKKDYEKILSKMQQAELEERADFLATMPIFHTWTRSSLKSLGQVMSTKSVPRNTIIIKQGDEPDGLYFVRKGTCVVLKQLLFREATLKALHDESSRLARIPASMMQQAALGVGAGGAGPGSSSATKVPTSKRPAAGGGAAGSAALSSGKAKGERPLGPGHSNALAMSQLRAVTRAAAALENPEAVAEENRKKQQRSQARAKYFTPYLSL
jgi:CRP-like cAMP-binding protein